MAGQQPQRQQGARKNEGGRLGGLVGGWLSCFGCGWWWLELLGCGLVVVVVSGVGVLDWCWLGLGLVLVGL